MATWDEKLATVLEPLEEHGFPVDLWDTEYIMDGRILINKFVKAVRVLKKKIVTEGVLEKLLEKGGSENYWETQGTCTPRQLYEFCHWLQEKEGTDFIFRARRACKLEEKLLADETPTDTAFVGALGYQIQEYDDLKRGTRVDLAKLKTEMVPGSAYKEMNRSVFEEACWDSFTKMIIVETVVPPEFSAENDGSSSFTNLFNAKQ
ncbi:hypothetical protein L1887_38898 [Cichorium endivia]|nr:hypothetical protein L1887_38898 [Cichorium endivia]